MSNKKFVYIGKYDCIAGFENEELTDALNRVKKIGKTDDLKTREGNLSPGKTKDFLTFGYLKVWENTSGGNPEKAIHTLLKDSRIGKSEWFKDEDDDLVDRLTDFMSHMNIKEKMKPVQVGKALQSWDYENKKLTEKKDLLVGEDFLAKKFGYNVKVSVQKNKKGEVVFFSHYLNKAFSSPSGAFQNSFKKYIKDNKKTDLYEVSCSINGWATPKNKKGDNLYEAIQKKLKKSRS